MYDTYILNTRSTEGTIEELYNADTPAAAAAAGTDRPPMPHPSNSIVASRLDYVW